MARYVKKRLSLSLAESTLIRLMFSTYNDLGQIGHSAYKKGLIQTPAS